jgi:hypothetical protein
MYRYGDGSQFPLEENFIDTLKAAVESCAAAYTPIADLDDRKERAREGRRQADKELLRLVELEAAMESAGDAFGPSTGRAATPVQQVAAKAIAAVKQAVATAKSQIQARVQQLEGEAAGVGLGAQIRGHLAPLFEKHQLPSTTWASAWDARGATAAGTAVSTAGKLMATYDLNVSGTWTQGVRIDLLAPGLTVMLPKRKAFAGGGKPAPVHLDKHALVAYERNAGHTTLIIRETFNKPSPGYKFTEDGGNWSAVPIDQNSDLQGSDVALTADDAAGLIALAQAATAAIDGFRASRVLRELRLGNQHVDSHPQPRVVIDSILAALTPLARSLREKSKVPGELVLKVDIGDGKREEIFVPRSQLAAKFNTLPPDYRKGFEDMGLARDQTQPGALGSAREASTLSDVISEIPTVVVENPVPPPPPIAPPHAPTMREKAASIPPPPPPPKAASGG